MKLAFVGLGQMGKHMAVNLLKCGAELTAVNRGSAAFAELEAKGVAVVIEAAHSCMTIRGVRKPGSICVTSAMRGIFRSNLSSRSEIMTLIYGDRR